MTDRFSMRTLAGTARAEVAVGIAREDSILAAVRAAAPLRRVLVSAQAPSSGEEAWGWGRCRT